MMTETKLDWIEEEIAALQEQGLFVNLRIIDSPAGAWMVVDGKRVLNLCTNNYLGLANDPRLCRPPRRRWIASAPGRRRCVPLPGRSPCTVN